MPRAVDSGQAALDGRFHGLEPRPECLHEHVQRIARVQQQLHAEIDPQTQDDTPPQPDEEAVQDTRDGGDVRHHHRQGCKKSYGGAYRPQDQDAIQE